MKRTMLDLQFVVPAMTEWVVEPGVELSVFSPKGDPRDPLTDLSQAYIAPKPFVLQPSYFTGFVTAAPLSQDEIDRLESALGMKMPQTLLCEVNRSISSFVCTVALQSRLATWKQIEVHLKHVLEACESITRGARNLVQLTDPELIDNLVARGALSADQLVRRMLASQGSLEKTALTIDLENVHTSCRQALEEIKSKIKRGRKPASIFRLFLGRLTKAMKEEGLNVKAPSNDNVFDKAHGTFIFVKLVVYICVEKGKVAIAASDLEEAERIEAVRAISHYRKSSRAIVHYFRDGSLG